MAKSVRSSVSKRNSAKLRETVFGPVSDARTARLSAKLQELASQPKSTDDEKADMKVDAIETDEQDRQTENQGPDTSEDMNVDGGTDQSAKSRSKKPGRIQKRQKKNRSSIVFTSNPSKSKRTPKRR